MREVNTEGINAKRLKILAKNYVRRGEAGDYIGVGKQCGRKMYDQLKKDLESQGIKVNDLGISVAAFNKYLGITTDEIIMFANKGL